MIKVKKRSIIKKDNVGKGKRNIKDMVEAKY